MINCFISWSAREAPLMVSSLVGWITVIEDSTTLYEHPWCSYLTLLNDINLKYTIWLVFYCLEIIVLIHMKMYIPKVNNCVLGTFNFIFEIIKLKL